MLHNTHGIPDECIPNKYRTKNNKIKTIAKNYSANYALTNGRMVKIFYVESNEDLDPPEYQFYYDIGEGSSLIAYNEIFDYLTRVHGIDPNMVDLYQKSFY